MLTPNQPIPPQTELHAKLAHLTAQERASVLSMLAKIVPAHNLEVMKLAKAVKPD
jgi:7,8-dihydro-6-hydroxymethylpterin-pyrophosphokinase